MEMRICRICVVDAYLQGMRWRCVFAGYALEMRISGVSAGNVYFSVVWCMSE